MHSATRSAAQATNSYDEFGIPGEDNAGRFQYTGQVWIPEIGMYYYKARMYSPTLGRFLQPDPIGYGDGLNIYNYVGSDPVNAVDPTGLSTVECDIGDEVCEDDGDEDAPNKIIVTGPREGSRSGGITGSIGALTFGRRARNGEERLIGHFTSSFTPVSDGPCHLTDDERRMLVQMFSTPFMSGTRP